MLRNLLNTKKKSFFTMDVNATNNEYYASYEDLEVSLMKIVKTEFNMCH